MTVAAFNGYSDMTNMANDMTRAKTMGDGMPDFSMNRRTLLGAAASLPVVSAGRSLKASTRDDVLVIGAGVAGLHAAMLMEDMGLTVKVIEAADRVGGRVNTLYDVESRPDAGAQEVGPMYARTLSTIDQLGLEMRDWMGGNIKYALNVRGATMDPGTWSDSKVNTLSGADREMPPYALSARYMPGADNPLEDIESWLEPTAHAYDISMGDHLRAEGASEEAIRLMSIGGQADSLDEESLLWRYRGQRVRIWARGQGQLKQIVGGMSELPRAMAASLNGDVVLNAPVAAMEDHGSHASVTCTDGRRFEAGRIICTMPTTVLKDVAILPGLPALQQQAIETLPYGEGTSVFLSIKDPFWEADEMGSSLWSDQNMRAFHWVNETAEYIWVFLAGAGNKPVRDLSEAECQAYVMEQLLAMRPAMKGRVNVEGVWCWSQNPWTRGTYAYRSPGHIRTYGNMAANAVGRIHFAGEHTAVLQPGLEGAMESGERAAIEVLETI